MEGSRTCSLLVQKDGSRAGSLPVPKEEKGDRGFGSNRSFGAGAESGTQRAFGSFRCAGRDAKITEGKLVPVSEVRSLLDYLATLPEPEPTVHRIRIWAHPLWAGLLVLLPGLFWTARKMIGAL